MIFKIYRRRGTAGSSSRSYRRIKNPYDDDDRYHAPDVDSWYDPDPVFRYHQDFVDKYYGTAPTTISHNKPAEVPKKGNGSPLPPGKMNLRIEIVHERSINR